MWRYMYKSQYSCASGFENNQIAIRASFCKTHLQADINRRGLRSDRGICEFALKDLRGAIDHSLAVGQRADCFYHIGLVTSTL